MHKKVTGKLSSRFTHNAPRRGQVHIRHSLLQPIIVLKAQKLQRKILIFFE